MFARASVAVLLLGLSTVSPLHGPGSGALRGRVVDSTGGVRLLVRRIILTDRGTSVVAEAETNGEGLFSFPSAQPGRLHGAPPH